MRPLLVVLLLVGLALAVLLVFWHLIEELLLESTSQSPSLPDGIEAARDIESDSTRSASPTS